jgi:hypothetical protein
VVVTLRGKSCRQSRAVRLSNSRSFRISSEPSRSRDHRYEFRIPHRGRDRVRKSDNAATAGAEPNQAVTAQRVNVDPKCEFALYRRPRGAPRRSRAQGDRPSGNGAHRSWPLPPLLHEGTSADTAYFEHHATAARRGFPMAFEHLGVEHVRRAENAVARQRFCPLQRIGFVVFFNGAG